MFTLKYKLYNKFIKIKQTNMPKTNKPWYTSNTVWIGIAIISASIFSYLETRYPQISIFGTIAGILVIINRFLSSGTPIK